MADHATLYLRTALFTPPVATGLVAQAQEAGLGQHVPPGTMIAVVELLEQHATHVVVRLTRAYDGRGRALGATDVVVWIPWDKIDHVHPG